MRYIIEGEMITVTQLHVASGEGNLRYDFATGRRIYGSSGGVPLAGTQHASLVLDEGGSFSAPCVNASTLRGGIRRAGARVAGRVLAAKGEKVDGKTFIRMMCGTSSGRPSKEATHVDEMDEIFNNPFVGLFGGGERMHRSRFVCGTAWPILEPFIGNGTVPVEFKPMASARAMTTVAVQRRVHDLLRNTARTIRDFKDVVEDIKKLAEEAIVEAAERTARKKKGESASDSDSMVDSINALEMVNPGCRFYVRFIADGDERHAGMLLKALENFANMDIIGGWGRNDFGRVRFDLRLISDDNNKPREVFLPDGMKLHPDVAELVNAFEEAAESEISAEKLTRMMA